MMTRSMIDKPLNRSVLQSRLARTFLVILEDCAKGKEIQVSKYYGSMQQFETQIVKHLCTPAVLYQIL